MRTQKRIKCHHYLTKHAFTGLFTVLIDDHSRSLPRLSRTCPWPLLCRIFAQTTRHLGRSVGKQNLSRHKLLLFISFDSATLDGNQVTKMKTRPAKFI